MKAKSLKSSRILRAHMPYFCRPGHILFTTSGCSIRVFRSFHAGVDNSGISMFIKVIPPYFMLKYLQHYFQLAAYQVLLACYLL